MARDVGFRDFQVRRVGAGDGAGDAVDRVAVEAPLEFRIDGAPGAVTMRTPGHDEDLVRGFLFAEGVIGAASDIRRFERIADDIVDVHLRSPLARTRLPERSTFATSSCGVCGKVSIESLRVRAAPIESAVRVPADVVAALPDALRAQQSVFDCTGGLHAAGLFSPEGNLWVGREDVGRHNAVDKVVGWALAAGRLPATDALLCVSGRLSFEIVQKAIAARVPLVAAVSAPSTAAVDLAREFGVTLCGFVRAGRFNCYTHAHRVC